MPPPSEPLTGTRFRGDFKFRNLRARPFNLVRRGPVAHHRTSKRLVCRPGGDDAAALEVTLFHSL